MEKSIDSKNMAQEKHYLGIDFGISKIGLALADEETKIAFAFDIFKNDKYFIENIIKIINEKNVDKVIIGITSHKNDTESKMKKISFGKMLEEKIDCDILYYEEMFTTKIAQNNLRESGKKNVTRNDDMEAARIILQSWIDFEPERIQKFQKSLESLKQTRSS